MIKALVATGRDGIKTTTMNLALLKKISKATAEQYVPQLQMDQLRAVTRHLRDIQDDNESLNPHQIVNRVQNESATEDYDFDLTPLEVHRVMHGDTDKVLKAATTSRRKVMQRNYWLKFKEAENKQLNKHFGHDLYGKPIPQK